MADLKYLPYDVAEQGELVTTFLKYNGVGVGRLVNGVVYVNCGNGDYKRGDLDVLPVLAWQRDGGQGYLERARKMFGGDR